LARLPEGNHQFPRDRFWKCILVSSLLGLLISASLVAVSVFDPHYPIYRSPITVVRVVLVNIFMTAGIGFAGWLFVLVAVRRDAVYPLTDEEKAAGKKFFFKWKRRHELSIQEKAFLKRRSSLRALFFSLIGGYILLPSALLLFLFFWSLEMAAVRDSFPRVVEPHGLGHSHHDNLHLLPILFMLSTALGLARWFCFKIRALWVFRQ
jgi:hypothetical protein